MPVQGNSAKAPALRRWLTDSREVGDARHGLFFALVGEHHNGHAYLADLYRRGGRAFVVSEPLDATEFPDACWWQVPDTLAALQALAAHWREQFGYPVVAITGSNGKTIVKEWLSQLAGSDFAVVKSPKSYNSQVGVPLSLSLMRPHHSLGVFEAGISQMGEMAKLEGMLNPVYGIFTNLGSAHDKGFDSRQAKLEEKAKLFAHCHHVVYCADHAIIHEYFTQQGTPERYWSWAWKADAPIRAHLADSTLTLTYPDQQYTFTVPFQDAVSLENLIHALVLLLGMGVAAERLQEGIALLRGPRMRLTLKDGRNDCSLIDDTYNNDLAGLEVALQFMDRQSPKGGKTVILSDMEEAGQSGAELMAAIEQQLLAHGVTRWWGVGPQHQAHTAKTSLNFKSFPNTKSLLKSLKHQPLVRELILVKGARSAQFEKVVSALQQRVHGTTLEVNLEALTHNLNVYRRRLNPGVKLMVMVKAMAYGSGSEEVARLLQFHRVDYLAVAYADEGVYLRQRGITLPIMVMNPSPESFGKLLEFDLEPELYSFRLLEAFGAYLRQQGQRCSVHLKIDTGMRRLGFEAHEAGALIQALEAYPEITPVTAFSHLAGADEAQHEAFSHQQAAAFQQAATELQAAGYPIQRHLLNSPGILRFPEYQFEMVRLGIGLYGVEAAGLDPEALRPVSRLVTTVSQVKEVPAGQTVGYGRHGVTEQPTRVATLAIGYADGYDRGFSRGVGEVLIRGRRAPVLGNVCMDMTMVDATGIPVQEGDEAIIFGPEISLAELANKIGTIPYELLTNVSTRVRRVYYLE